MKTTTPSPSTRRLAGGTPNRRILRTALTTFLLVSASSCIQPPPPRTYNPQVASHIRQISHDTPVTSMPSAYGGWGYYGCRTYWGY